MEHTITNDPLLQPTLADQKSTEVYSKSAYGPLRATPSQQAYIGDTAHCAILNPNSPVPHKLGLGENICHIGFVLQHCMTLHATDSLSAAKQMYTLPDV